jgi:hypothetical protein
VKKIAVETFIGKDGPPRGAGDRQPAALPGDTAVKEVVLRYDPKTGRAAGDIELPPLPSPAHRYYTRPVITDGDGRTRWYGAAGEPMKYVMERVPQTLAFRPAAAVTPAEVVSIGAFKFRDEDDDEFALGLNLRARYRERAAGPDGREFPFRLEPTGFSMTVMKDGKPVQADADTRMIARDTQFFSAGVSRDDEGNWVRARGDVTRVPPATREAVNDIGAQVLQSLEAVAVPLPNREVKPLETWKAKRDVVVGATSLSLAMSGVADYRYTYLGMSERNGKRVAFVQVDGTIRGRTGDGLDVGGRLDGRAEIDPATGEAVYSDVTLKADADLLTRQKTVLKVIGTLTVQQRRGDLPAPAPKKK